MFNAFSNMQRYAQNKLKKAKNATNMHEYVDKRFQYSLNMQLHALNVLLHRFLPINAVYAKQMQKYAQNKRTISSTMHIICKNKNKN